MEMMVVTAMMAILAIIIAPRLRDQVAKAQDARTIALLGSLRTISESYYAENQKKPYGEEDPILANTFDEVQNKDKLALNLLIPHLNIEGQKEFGSNGVWDPSDGYTVKIGGARDQQKSPVKYGGDIGYTFHAPEGVSADGISLWFIQKTLNPDSREYDTRGKKWIDY